MQKAFLNFLEHHCLAKHSDRILLAVSGGVDSVVMSHLFHQAGLNFALAHCNFQLRQEASDQDAQFVKELAQQLEVTFYDRTFTKSDFDDLKNHSTQMAARSLRYRWLEETRQGEKFDFIATAHHLGDTIETILYNIIKGTGISGLHGILPKKNKIIRPLLFAQKSEILNYVVEHELQYREDASNSSNKYVRNKLRNQVIPIFKEINPALEKTFSDNVKRFRDVELIYRQAIEDYEKKLIEKRRNGSYLSIRKLKKLPALSSILYEILKKHGFSNLQIEDIINSLDRESGKVFYSTTHRIIKDRKFLILTTKQQINSELLTIEEGDKTLIHDDFKLSIKTVKAEKHPIGNNTKLAAFDANKLQFPLQIRRWKQGDYFFPLGLGKARNPKKVGKKKVSKYFSDQKFSQIQKENAWILQDQEGRILWILNERMDNRLKITSATQKVIRFKLSHWKQE